MFIAEKLWGREIWLVNDKYCGKILELKPGFKSSYHCHKLKQETFYCLEGGFTLLHIDKPIYLIPMSEPITIKPYEYHSFWAREPTRILEVSTKHDEEDVYRKDESHKLTVFCFDIDGTICTQTPDAPDKPYNEAQPFPTIIKRINKLHDDGNSIVIFTARGSSTGLDWRDFTEKQLKDWGVKYDKLVLGKPEADIFIDDKCVNVRDW